MNEFFRETESLEPRDGPSLIDSYTSDLEAKFYQFYPFIGDLDSEPFQQFKDGKFPFCSFEIFTEDREFLKELLLVALKRAADRTDRAFCEHAFLRHRKEFKRTMRLLTRSILEEKVMIGDSLEIVDMGKKIVSDTNFILDSPWVKREGILIRARAVLADAVEVAHQLSDLCWKGTEKNYYISGKFRNISTSRLNRVYLIKRGIPRIVSE